MASAKHDMGVTAAEEWLQVNGYSLEDLPDIGGCRPDAFGKKPTGDGKTSEVLVEVETCESLTEDQSKQQMAAFADWAGRGRIRLAVLFVPCECLADAKRELPDYNQFEAY